ncbi:hypothetical protein C6H65_06885 [Photorhabdus luminescens]|nr:hypothetical protein C6H69_17670 [Photorhabdus luminescens]PQQ41916.1 hypothetical protein C6H65_06885 [Photorhabdus luminescens]
MLKEMESVKQLSFRFFKQKRFSLSSFYKPNVFSFPDTHLTSPFFIKLMFKFSLFPVFNFLTLKPEQITDMLIIFKLNA